MLLYYFINSKSSIASLFFKIITVGALLDPPTIKPSASSVVIINCLDCIHRGSVLWFYLDHCAYSYFNQGWFEQVQLFIIHYLQQTMHIFQVVNLNCFWPCEIIKEKVYSFSLTITRTLLANFRKLVF